MDRTRNIEICKFKLTSSVILNETTGKKWSLYSLFHDGGRDHKEKSPLICRANQWAFFFMITASVMKELRLFFPVFPFDRPKKIKKPKVSNIFRGIKRKHLKEKG